MAEAAFWFGAPLLWHGGGHQQYQDAKVVDKACLALTRIAESFARSPQRLESLCNYGLISNALQLVRAASLGLGLLRRRACLGLVCRCGLPLALRARTAYGIVTSL